MNNYMFGDKKNKIKDTERSLISETVSIEGTINSSGAIDVAGLVKGPVISKEIVIIKTLQANNGHIKGPPAIIKSVIYISTNSLFSSL